MNIKRLEQRNHEVITKVLRTFVVRACVPEDALASTGDLVIRSNKKGYLQGISFFFCELLFEKIYFVIAKKYIIDIISITDTICEYN